MLEERTVDLIHRDIDGETAPEEQSELRLRLDRDGDARFYHDGILDVSTALAGVRQLDPPDNFAAEVMRGVRAQAAQRLRESNTVARPLFGRTRDRFLAVRLGFGLAAVITIALILVPSLFRALDSSHLGGSMLSPIPAESWTVSAAAGTEIGVTTRDRVITLRFDPPSASMQSATLSFDPSLLAVSRTEGVTPSGPTPGLLRIAFRGEPALIELERKTDEPIVLSLRMGERSARDSETSIRIPERTNF